MSSETMQNIRTKQRKWKYLQIMTSHTRTATCCLQWVCAKTCVCKCKLPMHQDECSAPNPKEIEDHMLVAFKLQQNEFERCRLTPFQQHRCLAIPMVSTHCDLNTIIKSKLHSNSRCFFYLFGVNILWFTRTSYFSIFLTQEIIVVSTHKPCKCSKAFQNHWFANFTIVWLSFFLSFPQNPSWMDLQTQLLSSFYRAVKLQSTNQQANLAFQVKLYFKLLLDFNFRDM